MMRLIPMVMSALMVGTCGVINRSRRVLTIRTMALYGEKEEESEGAISEGKSKSLEAQNI